MIRHTSYPCICAYVMHTILYTGLPTFLMRVQRSGRPGMRLTIQHNNCAKGIRYNHRSSVVIQLSNTARLLHKRNHYNTTVSFFFHFELRYYYIIIYNMPWALELRVPKWIYCGEEREDNVEHAYRIILWHPPTDTFFDFVENAGKIEILVTHNSTIWERFLVGRSTIWHGSSVPIRLELHESVTGYNSRIHQYCLQVSIAISRSSSGQNDIHNGTNLSLNSPVSSV